MIVNYAGREWQLAVDKVTVEQWRELKRKYAMTPKAFQDGVNEADPDSMTFAYWVMLAQNGQPAGSLGDQIQVNVIQLNNAIATGAAEEEAEEQARKKAELEAEAARQAAAVPTRPAGPPSSAPPGPLTSGPTPPAQPLTTVSGSGSTTETSTTSTPSTSSSSPSSAVSELPTSAP